MCDGINEADFIFVSNKTLEQFNAGNPSKAVEPAVTTEHELRLATEQFEQVKTAGSNIVIEMLEFPLYISIHAPV